MTTSHTFSILFWMYSSRAKNNQASIYVRITVNGKPKNISLHRKGDVKAWDSSKQRLKGTNHNAVQTNLFLDQTHAKLFQIYQDLRIKNELITTELIKAHFLGMYEQGKTLCQLLDYHRLKSEKVLAAGTLRNFKITENYILKFLKQVKHTSDVYLSSLNYEFLCDFETYLRNYWPQGHPKAMSNNTVMKHIQRFRKIVTLGYNLEWIGHDPFRRWKPHYERTNRGFLSALELEFLESFEMPLERLDRVRDLFVFSCYTGISYSDLMQLTNQHLIEDEHQNVWIITKRQKTKVPVKVPLLDQAQRIIDKYKDHPVTVCTDHLLPTLTNEKLNVYLKEVATVVGISKNLTFHMARHTFATTVTLSNGVPIETVSKLLGHTKIATTQIYAKVLDHKLQEDVSNLRSKLNRNN